MTNRDELVNKLTVMRKEFEGFPEEQTLSEVIDELSTNDVRVTIPSPGGLVRVTDLLLMAKTLSGYCHGRLCSECVFNGDLGCAISSRWSQYIDAELLTKHEGEVAFYREDK